MNDNDASLPTTRDALELAVVTRETQELQSAYVMAKKFPRDEVRALERLRRCCANKEFALAAYFALDRSGKKMEKRPAEQKTAAGGLRWDKVMDEKGIASGATIRAAETVAQCWGNMDHGWLILADDGEYFDLKGYAVDLETNNRVQFFGHYRKRIQRKTWENGECTGTKWVEPDERQFAELAGSFGSKLQRNAILRCIPFYFTAELKRECLKTLGFDAEDEAKRAKLVGKMIRAYAKHGVTQDMLEAYVGEPLADCVNDDLQRLWMLGKSIEAGEIDVKDEFPDAQPPAKKEPEKREPAPQPMTADELEKKQAESAPASAQKSNLTDEKSEPAAPAQEVKAPAAAGEVQKDGTLVAAVLQAFAPHKITRAMLEKRVGKKLESCSDEALAFLNELAENIAAGQVNAAAEFPELKK